MSTVVLPGHDGESFPFLSARNENNTTDQKLHEVQTTSGIVSSTKEARVYIQVGNHLHVILVEDSRSASSLDDCAMSWVALTLGNHNENPKLTKKVNRPSHAAPTTLFFSSSQSKETTQSFMCLQFQWSTTSSRRNIKNVWNFSLKV